VAVSVSNRVRHAKPDFVCLRTKRPLTGSLHHPRQGCRDPVQSVSQCEVTGLQQQRKLVRHQDCGKQPCRRRRPRRLLDSSLHQTNPGVAVLAHATPSELALQSATGCLLATGVGEAPFLRQATIALSEDTQSMDAYARSGAHLAAIRAAYAGDFFSESMFVRFCRAR